VVVVLAWIAGAGALASAEPERRVYKQVDGRELGVDVFRPAGEAPEGGWPVIAFFHGGGWVFGEPAQFHPACRRYAGMGVVTCSFEYRLSMREDGTYPHPEITPVESTRDARSAMRWLKANAAELEIDPERIVAAGRSAGAQLAWATALCGGVDEPGEDLEVSPRPAAILVFSGCFNTVAEWCDWVLDDERPMIWKISPYHRLRKDVPPALAFHGRDDPTVPHFSARFFDEKTRALGNEFELVTLAATGHQLAEGEDSSGGSFDDRIRAKADAFLREQGILSGR